MTPRAGSVQRGTENLGMTRRMTPIALMTLAAIVAGGCPEIGALIPGFNTVTVEVVNDTSFSVDPNIRYDNDPGLLAGLFPADTLNTGLIGAGATMTFTFDCDSVGTIFSDEAEQVTLLFGDYVADATDRLEREKEFDCGDVIRLRFVGDALDFGVIVSVNGRIVD